MHRSPYRYLLGGALIGVVAAALAVGLVGYFRPAPHTTAAQAMAAVKGIGRKPIKANLLPRPSATAAGQPTDPLWGDSWSLAKVRAPGAWRLTTGTADTVVAVLDTGIDREHPDLQGSFVAGWDAVNEDEDPSDDHGHGTLVAGVIAARPDNGIGSVGGCPRCSLMPVKVIAANGSGSATDIAEGIRWAADHGADVINMSFALSGGDDNVAAAIEHARGLGSLVVAAAGNAGAGDMTYPAAYPGVVSVAATDRDDLRYDWSNYGGWVQLAAPGCSIATAAGGSYASFCGTSSATALVSGLAALIHSYAPTLTNDALAQALSANALKVGSFVSAGRVDAEAAFRSVKPVGPPAADPGARVATRAD